MDRQSRRPLYIVAFLAVCGLILLIVGIVLLVKTKACEKRIGEEKPTSSKQRCEYSTEAVNFGLDKFLQKVQDSYYKAFPSDIVYKAGVKVDEIKRTFKPFDPSPENLKKITDTAKELLREINAKEIKMASLKPREKKALFRVKHFLQFTFASPYDVNYYAGDFLMGPNLFCWQPICDISRQVHYALRYYMPKEVEDLDVLKDKMALFNETFEKYMANTRYGIKAGMVRSVEECKAGLDAIKRMFFKVALGGPKGE